MRTSEPRVAPVGRIGLGALALGALARPSRPSLIAVACALCSSCAAVVEPRAGATGLISIRPAQWFGSPPVDWITLLIVVTGTVVALGALRSAKAQAVAAQSQADAAWKAHHAQQRPWVGVFDVRLLEEPHYGRPLRIVTVVRNVGSTPAVRVRTYRQARGIEPGDSLPAALDVASPEEPQSLGVLVPGAEYSMTTPSTQPLNENQVRALMAGRCEIHLLVEIRYRSPAAPDAEYLTTWRGQWNGTDLRFRIGSEGNDAT